MLWMIYGMDRAGSDADRDAHYPAHKAFLASAEQWKVQIVMSGPLTKDDQSSDVGSLFIIDAADRSTAENFHHSDPFYKAGIWEASAVTAFNKKRG